MKIDTRGMVWLQLVLAAALLILFTGSNVVVASEKLRRDTDGGPSKPRVRREWRTLDNVTKHKVARAFWVLRNLTTAEGRARYGPNFFSHDDFVLLHSCAIDDPRCDQGHFGPSFILFHRAFILKYEKALRAVDPTIEAVPYWHMALDGLEGAYRNDPKKWIFTGNYFGDLFTKPQDNYAVTNGLFAYWPVSKYNSAIHGKESILASVSTCLREEWFQPPVCNASDPSSHRMLRMHSDCTPYVTRNPAEPAGVNNAPGVGGTLEILFTEEDFQACIGTDIKYWMAWENCIEASKLECLPNAPEVLPLVNFQNLMEFARQSKFSPTIDQLQATMQSVANVTSDANANRGFCDGFMFHGVKHGTPLTYRPRQFHGQAHFKVAKDFRDVWTSINDAALFIGYHANMDRSNFHWMYNTKDTLQRSYWQYPRHVFDMQAAGRPPYGLNGPYGLGTLFECGRNLTKYNKYHPLRTPWIPGTTLNSVLNSGYPFFDLFDEYDGRPNGYTLKDMLYYTSPDRTPYTYDTLEQYYN